MSLSPALRAQGRDRHDEDAVGPPVRESSTSHHHEGGGLAVLVFVDLACHVQQRLGRSVRLGFTELELESGPATVGELENGVDLLVQLRVAP